MSAEEITGFPAAASSDPLPGSDADTRPQPLTLASVSRDHRRLHLVDAGGREFTIEVDDHLLAAVGGASGRTLTSSAPASGRLEITVDNKTDSTLRPRDIQARIRAGESPESVADAAHTTVERIMPYAAPVLAEREHVAERAQKSSVRRRGTESGSTARTLGDAVAAHLRAIDLEPEVVEWDAWRRNDGRWSLVALYSTPARSGTAELTYDLRGNFVVLDNDDARWLVGDQLSSPVSTPVPAAQEPVRDDLQQARQRRLSPVTTDEQLPLGPDVIDPIAEQPLEAYLDDEAPTAEQPRVEDASVEEPARRAEPPAAREPKVEQPAQDEPAARRPVTKKRGRASVPSWDEIMFGGGSSDPA